MDFFHTPPFLIPPKVSIATIGNFDGMHCGHQQLLCQLKKLAQQKDLAATVILFEPQPLEYFKPAEPPARLQRLSDKLNFLKQHGIDQVICMRFHDQFAKLSPREFIISRLCQQMNVVALLVGEDFRFGCARAGDLALLHTYEKEGLLEIFTFPLVAQAEERISSTKLRQCLQQGDFQEAAQLLGRPYSISGKVMHGQKRGRLLNFPTANLYLHRHRSPLHGVYAIKAMLPDGQKFLGVANVGMRPTVSQSAEWFLEAFLFAEQDLRLYGQRISIEFLAKVREEKRFESLDALKQQIEQDVIWVKTRYSTSD